MADMRQKNRCDYVAGSRHGEAKLTERSVADIRRRYTRRAAGVAGNGKDLAVEFGVTHSIIYAIVNGRRWKHVR